MSENKLTQKQRTFVSGVLKGKTKAQAAIEAGYSKKSAARNTHKLMSKESVSKAVDEGQKARNKRLEIEEDFELVRFIRLYEVCIEHIIEDGIFNSNAASNAINALDKVAKIRGLYVTKVDIGVDKDLAAQVSRLKDDK